MKYEFTRQVEPQKRPKSFLSTLLKPGLRFPLWLLVLVFFSPGCLDPIELEAPKDILSAVVIQGRLTKGSPSVVRAEVSALFNFSGSSRRLIDVREVHLLDESGQSLEIPSVDLGVYELEIPEGHPSFRIETGSAYRLRVATRDRRVYESTPEPVLATPAAGNLSATIIDKEISNREGELAKVRFIQFSIDTRLTNAEGGPKARLKWDAIRTFRVTDLAIEDPDPKTCYITQFADINTLYLLDGGLIAGEEATGVTVHEEPVSNLFAEGYYLSVLQQSLSEGAFDYWRQANELIERTGSIFEPPAGKLRSNFTNINDPEEEAFGFFYATAPDTVRLFVSPELAGNPATRCPPTGPLFNQSGDCAYPICCDCLSAPNSTVSRPDFWIE